jgi:hypothetical protein
MVSRKQKKIDALIRREAFKEPRKSILIVCEGKKTEPIYFNSLKNKLKITIADIEVVGAGAVPITVVERAIALKEQRNRIAKNSLTKAEYDVIYCLIDAEMPVQHPNISNAFSKAQANNIEVILSNPCFEYWYLLHFKKTSVSFYSNAEVIKALKKCHANYDKSNRTICDAIYNKTAQAIKNSKEVIKEHHNGSTDLKNCNPSTHVHLIVEELLKMV